MWIYNSFVAAAIVLALSATAQDEGFVCPGPIEDVLYNVDMQLENVGCDEYDDLKGIGQVLQRVARQVEATIPVYDDESMRTTLCLLPIAEDDGYERLLLRGTDQSQRRLAGRYHYRGGGRCRRCRADNADNKNRRYLDEVDISVKGVCEIAAVATFAGEIALTALENVDKVLLELRTRAMQCDDLERARDMVLRARETRKKCQDRKDVALDAAYVAEWWCDEAKKGSAASHEELKKSVEEAGKSKDKALIAAENARDLFFETRLIVKSTECMKDNSTVLETYIDNQKNELEELLDETEDEIKELEKEIEKTTDETIEKQLVAEKEALVQQTQQLYEAIEITSDLVQRSSGNQGLDEWLMDFAMKFMEVIPGELVKEYNANSAGKTCQLDRVKVRVSMEAVESRRERINPRDCSEIQIPN